MRRGRKTTRVPARIKTRPVRGSGEDAGRYFRCSYCGFVCDLERDTLEGDNAKAGNDTAIVVTDSFPDDSLPTRHSSYVPNVLPFILESTAGYVAVLSGDLNFYHTAMKVGSDGEAKVVYHAFEPEVDFGCPFCGTTNWKG